MASCGNRGKNGSFFIPKKPRFMRFILNETMKNQKIAIPQRFLSIHGKSLSKLALLKVPTGATWKVELLKHEDEVSFEQGWEKFVAYYSIDYGDFLCFEYEGNSQFNVFIIGKSFVEVDYPWNGPDAAAESNQEENFESDQEENFESDQEENFEDPEEEGDDDDTAAAAAAEFSGKNSVDSEETGKGTKGKEKLGCSRNSEGDLGGKSPLAVLKPDNPRFTVQIRDTHLPPHAALNIPAWFARKYLKKTKGNVTLRVLDGGSWTVKYRTCGTSKEARIRFQGWADFARDNCLVVDNICSFDLLKVESDKVTFQVTISRPNQH